MNRLSFVLATAIAAGVPALARASANHMTVYKSPTCGCCEAWIAYLQSAGYIIDAKNVLDMAPVKKRFGVVPALESCHTGVIEGYVVEGHIPHQAIEKMLASRPAIRGIALPGMPSGSPGMGGTPHGALNVVELQRPNNVYYTF